MFHKNCGRKLAQNFCILYGIACLYDESRLTLATSNNPCKFYYKIFSRDFINIIEIHPVGTIIFKKACRRNECLNHELYKRSFYNKSLCILYVHDLIMRSRIKGLKDYLKL